jgi:predicted lipoprotein with Yx(FWY)xxD motif
MRRTAIKEWVGEMIRWALYPRRLSAVVLAVVLAIGVGLGAGATAASAAAPAKTKSKPLTLKLANSSQGMIVVSANGHTLYAYGPDDTTTTVSHCTGACAQAWPPYTAHGKPTVGKGLTANKVTLGARHQLAYGGHLLYRFKGDTQPGQTTGQGVNNFHVLFADGSVHS